MPTGLAIATAVGCAVNGGVFFAFSSFVMAALRRLAPAQGIAAMQSINVLAVTPVFMTVLFGTGAACIALAAAEPSALVLAATAAYLVGVPGLTMAYNVPRNDALAALDPAPPGGGRGVGALRPRVDGRQPRALAGGRRRRAACCARRSPAERGRPRYFAGWLHVPPGGRRGRATSPRPSATS